MKRILLPTDFSENSWNAIRYILELMKKEECEFHLLNTYTPVIPTSRFMASNLPSSSLDEGNKETSLRGLEEIMKKIKKGYRNKKHTFKLRSSFNILVEEVRNIVEQEGIHLVVTGTKGASGVDEVFLGSNTVRIIKAVKECPVLTIPKDFAYVKPQEVVFATDFKRYYSRTELQPLIDLAKSFKATIRIVYVQNKIRALTEIQQFNLNMLRKYFEKIDHYIHTVSELNSVSKTLEVFADELDIHLLAMLNYQHSYMERMTREPVVRRMAFHTQVPLLVIPELGMSAPGNPKKEKEMQLVK
ncbi:Nucleotide-binding universal stress protein, UspA family [Muriicola jejuensis]|uniref:Universal stress protein n=1 Tax=Muriicola jejuensis TaxID=504488 RepID=A0A6P0U973_9FLAO|nr:universal stress protein [Muriicola jejuensis]NER09587.1 universal stress protein [Muriicola jejuensis]SMP07554.1 Nucleotide-binding universal stress protein, UspA family [Muriicola jejuensis]